MPRGVRAILAGPSASGCLRADGRSTRPRAGRATGRRRCLTATAVPCGYAQIHRTITLHIRYLRVILVLPELEATEGCIRRGTQSILAGILRTFVVPRPVQWDPCHSYIS